MMQQNLMHRPTDQPPQKIPDMSMKGTGIKLYTWCTVSMQVTTMST